MISGIEYATALGCRRVNCLAGIPPKDVPAVEARRTFVENLQHAAPEFAKAGILLVIEAINTRDIPGFFLSRSAQAIEIMDEVGSDNLLAAVRLLPHADHGGRPRPDLPPAQGPDRPRPDRGQSRPQRARHRRDQLPFIFGALDEAGYEGFVGCEYKPASDHLGRPRLVRPLSQTRRLNRRHTRSNAHEGRLHRSRHHGPAHGAQPRQGRARAVPAFAAAACRRRCSMRAAPPAARPRRWPSRPR